MDTCACGCGTPTPRTWAWGHNPKGTPANKLPPPLPEDRGYGTPCLIWQGVPNAQGYGQCWHQGAVQTAHRGAWLDAHGPIPDGLVIDHLCDQKMCVNVEHMALKTRGENVRRANLRASASNPCIKLSTKDVEDIRALEFVSQSEIARAYGVSQTTISRIRKGLPRRAGRKLTNQQRAAVWSDTRPAAEVATEFGVSASLVTIIRRGASPTATLLNSREGNPHV